jgi:hypothetical protein
MEEPSGEGKGAAVQERDACVFEGGPGAQC